MNVGIKMMKIWPVITSVITTLVATTAPVALDTNFILTTEPAKVNVKAQHGAPREQCVYGQYLAHWCH